MFLYSHFVDGDVADRIDRGRIRLDLYWLFDFGDPALDDEVSDTVNGRVKLDGAGNLEIRLSYGRAVLERQ